MGQVLRQSEHGPSPEAERAQAKSRGRAGMGRVPGQSESQGRAGTGRVLWQSELAMPGVVVERVLDGGWQVEAAWPRALEPAGTEWNL
eukprot:g31298.t1